MLSQKLGQTSYANVTTWSSYNTRYSLHWAIMNLPTAVEMLLLLFIFFFSPSLYFKMLKASLFPLPNTTYKLCLTSLMSCWIRAIEKIFPLSLPDRECNTQIAKKEVGVSIFSNEKIITALYNSKSLLWDKLCVLWSRQFVLIFFQLVSITYN